MIPNKLIFIASTNGIPQATFISAVYPKVFTENNTKPTQFSEDRAVREVRLLSYTQKQLLTHNRRITL